MKFTRILSKMFSLNWIKLEIFRRKDAVVYEKHCMDLQVVCVGGMLFRSAAALLLWFKKSSFVKTFGREIVSKYKIEKEPKF